jgi:hypothetical protein
MKRSKFKPGQLVEPIQPVAIDVEVDGVFQSHVFNPGRSRVRADHPAVRSNPDFFKALDPEFLKEEAEGAKSADS